MADRRKPSNFRKSTRCQRGTSTPCSTRTVEGTGRACIRYRSTRGCVFFLSLVFLTPVLGLLAMVCSASRRTQLRGRFFVCLCLWRTFSIPPTISYTRHVHVLLELSTFHLYLYCFRTLPTQLSQSSSPRGVPSIIHHTPHVIRYTQINWSIEGIPSHLPRTSFPGKIDHLRHITTPRIRLRWSVAGRAVVHSFFPFLLLALSIYFVHRFASSLHMYVNAWMDDADAFLPSRNRSPNARIPRVSRLSAPLAFASLPSTLYRTLTSSTLYYSLSVLFIIHLRLCSANRKTK